MNNYNQLIKDFEATIGFGNSKQTEKSLYCGVDLGTANIVLSVVNETGQPIAGRIFASRVIRDGVVVDYVGAIDIVRRLKKELEEELGVQLIHAATAIPPGVEEGCVKAIRNVIEAADFDLVKVVDEPSAAARVMAIEDGAVVDVGGGTTGISILKAGQVIFTADEPTGGHHMTLVLAGSKRLDYDSAEILKHDLKRESDVFPIIRPVIEKMASIVKRFISGYATDTIYVVGGACTMKAYESVFENELSIKTIKPNNPMLVTPLGIALVCRDEVQVDG